jgi:hypothetical protein
MYSKSFVSSLTLLLPVIASPGCAGAGAGAGAGNRSTYESCLREPRSWGEGATRMGYVSAHKLEIESYGYGHGPGSPESRFRALITRKDCKDTLRGC